MKNITITMHEKKLIYVKDFKNNVTIIKDEEFDINDYPVYLNIIKVIEEQLENGEELNIHYHKIPTEVFKVLKYSNPNYIFTYIHELEDVEALNQEITDYLASVREMEVKEIVIATETCESKINGETVSTIASVSSDGNVEIIDEKIKGKPIAEFIGLLKAYKKFTKNNNLKHIVTLEASNDFTKKIIEEPFHDRGEAKEFLEVKLVEAGINKRNVFHYLTIYEDIINKYVKNELKVIKVKNNGSFLKRYAGRFATQSKNFRNSSKYFTSSNTYRKIYGDYKKFLRKRNYTVA